MKLVARVILVLLATAVLGVVLFGIPYWTREGEYLSNANLYWYLLGPIVLGGSLVAILVIEGVMRLLKIALKIARWE